MRALRPIVALALVFTFVAAPLGGAAAFAQQQDQARSVVDTGDLNAALRGRLDDERLARESVLHVLQRAEVQDIAAGLGIDLRDAESAVHTLGGDELQTVAAHATTLDEALSGGATIHISLIAAVLIIIIVILLVD